MMVASAHFENIDSVEYKRRIRAWTLYDWANSAFVTTVLAAVLPVYFSDVAGANLPSRAIATQYWSLSLSISLFIAALMSPVLGTVSDVIRGKKRFLAIFAGIGVVATALLVLVGTGDWVLAAVLAVLGRIGFNGSISFYDSLLPHVAKPEDQDAVSARGYAMGYLGGGLLLAVNVVMILVLPGTWGARLSFVSVALWWAIFSIPLFRRIPEPPSASAKLQHRESVLGVSVKRLVATMKDLQRYGELFKFLVAFLIYNDAIGTIIGIAAIYGAELGFGTIELVLALLLVQFVGIPFSLIFGRLPSKEEKRRPIYFAFIIINLFALPVAGLVGAAMLPMSVVGTPSPSYTSSATAVGEGAYSASDSSIIPSGEWLTSIISATELNSPTDTTYFDSNTSGARLDLPFNGQQVEISYRSGPDHGIWRVEIDGKPLLAKDGIPITVDGYSPNVRYGETVKFQADQPGEHFITLINSGEKASDSTDTIMSIAQIRVLPPIRQSNLPLIIGILLAIQGIAAVLALLLGKRFFSKLAQSLDTRRSILLALVVYTVISIWGFVLNSTIEYWFLAWMVAIVQGGSQSLSRSLFSSMSPAIKSGEFFGLFGVMEKFSAIVGPLLFAAAVAIFGNSRPAILTLIAFFIIGGYLLTRVDIQEGVRIARDEDATLVPSK
ncbi:MAG: MFS transporter [Anaerolineae bacterium]